MVNGVERSSHASPISNTDDVEMEEVEAGAPISTLAGVKVSGAAPPSQVLGSRNLTATIQILTKQVEQVAAAFARQELTGKQLANNLPMQTNGSAINSSNSQPTVVPQNLPLFQYTGNVENSALPVYKDIVECISHFEDILFAYRLDVQVHWQRLIPFSLTHTQRSWHDELRLLTISMQLDKSVGKYTDRFLKLKPEATPVADDFLAILFVNSLTNSFRNHVVMF
ncbi:hypothetical protein G6F46_013303 [Rhizopus delemar]|uniref:Retrotransposon gag domain-containing protein n=3 Tax=Rhizopus TaxID=4842 RepID=I1C6Q3_RHIO9|nr:hypothetical protein RO3G_08843 [Rhizopus delemar RA 99-880]KAG1441765.1 hypothetical protein G6F55_013155 [Rhizopus delemar]KAG1531684.1 hypothetical protein G6F51_013423 [Rhizopus arrhizus]KAG1486838.1 hypothetical protein G6F54_013050 [Rhizopus delemar]KAG1491104.1 hypothetical protein G6F53_013150 [Rhizopus delemar]|eukprot:EIE84133.1 hypothetical protein RO3G_08843 [Rhizopus delemar RA 99-880]